MIPPVPENEKARLKELLTFSLLDTLPEADYDNITAIASELCGVPIAQITLIDEDRTWFKSSLGMGGTHAPRNESMCAHTIGDPHNMLIVPDSTQDKRFFDSPFVVNNPFIRFYAGVPLVTSSGLAMGTLCIVDLKPKNLTEGQIVTLRALARQVMNLMELRRKKLTLEDTLKKLEQKNQELERFAYIAAHDIKSPLNNISSLTRMFVSDYGNILDPQGAELIDYIGRSSDKLRTLVDGLLEYSKSEQVLKANKTEIKTKELLQDIYTLFAYKTESKITLNTTLDSIVANPSALNQILINLVANGIKYNDKENCIIEIGITENATHYTFSVKDNGRGIAKEYQERIFTIFEVLSGSDRFGEQGSGIGLATVKKLVEAQGGQIYVESEQGKGSNFVFTLAKE